MSEEDGEAGYAFVLNFVGKKKIDWSMSWGNNEAETERCGPLNQTDYSFS